MAKFEYKEVESYLSPTSLRELNQLGAEGWELASSYWKCGKTIWFASIFKRPIEGPSDAE